MESPFFFSPRTPFRFCGVTVLRTKNILCWLHSWQKTDQNTRKVKYILWYGNEGTWFTLVLVLPSLQYCSMLTVRFWNFSVSTIFQCEFQWFSVQLYWEHLVLSGCKIAPSDMTSKLCSVQWGSGVQCRLRELKAGVPCLKGFA